MNWQTARFDIDLATPRVMGIVNLTPDSFSGDGRGADVSAAIEQAERLVTEGADVIDLGAESSRPGAAPVDDADEWQRLEPVLCAALRLGVPVSVDTAKPLVMRRALDAGADIDNDIRALRADGALAALAAHPRAGVCLMHMQGEPRSMQHAPAYADVVTDVVAFLRTRVAAVQAAGIDPSRIAVDPGIGFGKTPDHNLALLRRQGELAAIGRPLLVGWSRKSTLGVLTGRPVAERQAASVAAALLAVQRGAHLVRVHDVAATVDALKLWRAVT